MPSAYKLVPIKPVSGIFDVRSLPDEIGAGSFSLVKNMSVRAIGRRCRRGGWTKLFTDQAANNFDLHDQLIGEQLYYTGYSAFLAGGGDFDHYAYQYYYPELSVPGASVTTLYGGGADLSGNPYGMFPFAFTPNACWVWFYYGFEPGDYYRLYCNTTVADQMTAGYPYGNNVPIYDPVFGYQYDYCGTVPLVRGGCSEAVTYLAEFRSPRNFRKLVAGTKSRLYALNERTGNWRILADGLGGNVGALDCVGCSQRRFLSAQMDSILILTNQFDPPLFWFFDDSAVAGDGNNCDLWSARPIPDLEDLNITKVGCVAQHKGFMFYCDVEQDGTYYPHRVIWSDYKNPISVLPTTDSLAGFQDIGSGERILRAEPLGDYLYIYTDQGIHRGSLVSTGETWNFEQIYRGQDACKYKFSLVNTGDEHFYLSNDRLLTMTLSDANPLEVPWMRATSKLIFDGIDEFETTYGALNNDQCDLVTGGYNSILKELWFSWPTGDNLCPNVSLVFNLTRGQEAADLVDHGFTAFCVFESDRLPTVADWLQELGVCTRGELPPLIKEGPEIQEVEPTASPTCIWNETENPDLPVSPESLCAVLQNKYPEDFCAPCAGSKRFAMASATDRCLKEYADGLYYREMVEDGLYVLNGYSSILSSGSENLRIDADKDLRRIKVEVKAEPQTTPSTLFCSVGYGQQSSCMTFKNLRNVNPDGTIEAGVPLRCLSDTSASQHAANQTRPGLDVVFQAAVSGKFFAYRLFTGETTGGAFCLSQVQLDIRKREFE